ncbi:MAG: hypothetical protein IT371_10665 [Deltaproteobacteria bacterium]|nr:hypothetical protein [Deltaproteobacteria bacterium]
MLRVVLVVAGLAGLLLPTRAGARNTVVGGGRASVAYVYSGKQGSNIWAEPSAHDARFEVAGLFGHQYARPSFESANAVFAGAILAANNADFRAPVARVHSAQTWRVLRRLQLAGTLFAELEPLSIGEAGVAIPGSLTTNLSLVLDPTVEALARLAEHDALLLRLGTHLFAWFRDRATITDNDVWVSAGTHLTAEWEHSFNEAHEGSVRALARVMDVGVGYRPATPNRKASVPPTSVLVGAMAGYRYSRRERFSLAARAGVGRVLNQPDGPLWPVEPLVELEASWANRLDALHLMASSTIQENNYVGGFPERIVQLRGRWVRQAGNSPWRGFAEAAYELSRFGTHYFAAGEANTLHALRLRGQLIYAVSRGWRVFGGLAASVGVQNLSRPDICGTPECPRNGVWLSGLAGAAYIFTPRPTDERLIAEVW